MKNKKPKIATSIETNKMSGTKVLATIIAEGAAAFTVGTLRKSKSSKFTQNCERCGKLTEKQFCYRCSCVEKSQ